MPTMHKRPYHLPEGKSDDFVQAIKKENDDAVPVSFPPPLLEASATTSSASSTSGSMLLEEQKKNDDHQPQQHRQEEDKDHLQSTIKSGHKNKRIKIGDDAPSSAYSSTTNSGGDEDPGPSSSRATTQQVAQQRFVPPPMAPAMRQLSQHHQHQQHQQQYYPLQYQQHQYYPQQQHPSQVYQTPYYPPYANAASVQHAAQQEHFRQEHFLRESSVRAAFQQAHFHQATFAIPQRQQGNKIDPRLAPYSAISNAPLPPPSYGAMKKSAQSRRQHQLSFPPGVLLHNQHKSMVVPARAWPNFSSPFFTAEHPPSMYHQHSRSAPPFLQSSQVTPPTPTVAFPKTGINSVLNVTTNETSKSNAKQKKTAAEEETTSTATPDQSAKDYDMEDFDRPRFIDGKEQQLRQLLVEQGTYITTRFTHAVIEHLDFIYFEEPDRRSHRDHLPIGFRGIGCRYCNASPGKSGRFFPSSLKTLSDTNKTLFTLHRHFIKCKATPSIVKLNLDELRMDHSRERKMRSHHGSQRTFFRRVWGFLCPESSNFRFDISKFEAGNDKARNDNLTRELKESAAGHDKSKDDTLIREDGKNVADDNYEKGTVVQEEEKSAGDDTSNNCTISQGKARNDNLTRELKESAAGHDKSRDDTVIREDGKNVADDKYEKGTVAQEEEKSVGDDTSNNGTVPQDYGNHDGKDGDKIMNRAL